MANNQLNSSFTGQGVNSPVKTQQKGTGFTNLNQYLDANQGNKLGQTIVGGINQDVNKLNQGLQQSQSDFDQSVSGVNDKTNNYQTQADQTFNSLQNKYNDLSNQYAAAPTNYTATDYGQHNLLNPSDASTFQDIRDYKYSGPTQLANYDKLQNQAQQTEQLGNLTNSTSGRAALLNRYVNNPQYNTFQQNLDALYLQNSNPELQQAKRQATGLVNNLSSAQSNAANQAEQASRNISGLQTNVQGGIDTRVGDQLGRLDNSVTQNLNDKNALTSALTRLGSGEQLSDSELGLTGLNRGTRLFNVGSQANNYLTGSNFDPTKQNVANIADRANLDALRQLSGNSSAAIDLNAQQYTPTAFNKDSFNTALGQANSNYDNSLNTTQNPYQNGFNPMGSGISNVGGAYNSDVSYLQNHLNNILQQSNSQELLGGLTSQQQDAIRAGNITPELLNGLDRVDPRAAFIESNRIRELRALVPALEQIKQNYGYNNVIK